MPQPVLDQSQIATGVSLMPTSIQSILDVFVIQGLVSVADADSLKNRFRTNREVEQYLVNNRIVSRDTINKAYSILLKLPYISLTNVKIPYEILSIIPKRLSEKFGVVAFARRENNLLLAVARPALLMASYSSGLEKLLYDKHLLVELYITGQSDFESAIRQYSSAKGKTLLLEKGSLPTVFLRNQDISTELLGKFPIDFVENFRAIIFYQRGDDNFAVALEKPDDPATRGAIDKIAKENKVTFQLFATSKEDIDYVINLYRKKLEQIKVEKEAAPVLSRPQAKKPAPPRPQEKARRSDDEVITLSGLFGSFLGSGKKDSLQTNERPVVTVDERRGELAKNNSGKSETVPIKKEALKEPGLPLEKEDESKMKPADKNQELETDQAGKNAPEDKNSIIPQEQKQEATSENIPDEEESEDSQIKDDNTIDASKIGTLLSGEIKSDEDLKKVLKDNYIPKTVAGLVNYALNLRASDIHVEPGAKNLRVRFRVDGILRDIAVLPLKLHPPITSRIKILSKMKLDETRIPQDGRFDLMFKNREVDVRVSCLPTVHGEKMVMRILDKSQDILSLEDLGMMGRTFDLTIEAIKKPYGVILSTGPTGSGKSTTLYAIINRLSSPSVNIVTLEDPVEYEIPGVNQCQVKPSIGFTFADGLRSVLRQDPNVVMVGEIRDGETAGMATHAALTGHLVLSTLHTNDAAGALPRLTNMGIEPFLITSSLNLVIAQRLVRRVCPDCKRESKLPDSLIGEIKNELARIPRNNPADMKRAQKPLKFYHGVGCSKCTQGYRGRVGIFEVIRVVEKVEELAVARRPASDIKAAAIQDGMISMKQDGIMKAMEGLTTLNEVFQATTS